jgi:hypothetical protein
MRLENIDLQADGRLEGGRMVEQALEREESLRTETDDGDAKGAVALIPSRGG